ncbi:MAG TPA: cytochrome c biogenesis protein CcsA [Verrucomicrobiae bacterium]|nr:cytochrome c biogenesis protein CcsA [Verrucomicrobiae bacterium]
MELGLLRLAIALYLAGTVAALLGIAVRQDLPRTLLPRLLWAGFVAHALSIAVRSWTAGHMAVTTFDEALSFLALLVMAVFLLVQLRRPLVALGAVVSPLAFGLTLAADAVYRGARPLPPVLDSAWLPIHVVLSVLGDAVFALAFSASLLYLVQERRLKARRGPAVLRYLPSLETLDRVNYGCLVWGLVLLTLGMVTGIVWAHTAWVGFWYRDPKVLLSLLVWGIYVVLLQGRMSAGWRGRWAATLTIAGFAVIVLSLVGVNVLALGNHGKAF